MSLAEELADLWIPAIGGSAIGASYEIRDNQEMRKAFASNVRHALTKVVDEAIERCAQEAEDCWETFPSVEERIFPGQFIAKCIRALKS